NVFYGSTAQTSGATIFGTMSQGAPFDFGATAAKLAAASARLVSLPVNGTTTIQWGGVYLTGTSSTLNVYQLSSDAPGSTRGANLSAPAGSMNVINVTGASARMQYFGFNTG